MPTYLPATRYGGPIQSVHGLCKALAAQGHEVHVYTTNVDGPGVSLVPLGETVMRDGVAVSYFAAGTPRRIYRSPTMRERLNQTIHEFNIVHIHAVFVWPGLAASRAARRHEVPYLVSPRGMLVPELIARKSRLAKIAWLRLFDRAMLRRASAVHVTSSREAQDLTAAGIDASHIVEIPNGIAIPDFAARQPVERQQHVLYLGRLDPKKSIDLLLQAMVLVPGVTLLIAGDGAPDHVADLKRMVADFALQDRVTFLGHLDDTTKWAYYRQASLLVLPSLSENFANVVLEAMVAGCPVIVTPGVGLAETVAKHDCGRVVPRDANAIARAVRELLGNAPLRERLGANGAAAAEQEFSWEAVADRYISTYRALSSGEGESARKTESAAA